MIEDKRKAAKAGKKIPEQPEQELHKLSEIKTWEIVLGDTCNDLKFKITKDNIENHEPEHHHADGADS